MPSKIRHGLLISLVVVSLFVMWFGNSHAETTNYIYDELNRLKRVVYEDGTIIEFTYDGAGNRLAMQPPDTTPPTGTITINSGEPVTNNPAVTLTLTCSDNIVCSQMQFSNDDVTYSTAEAYGTTKSLTLSPGDGTKTVYVKFKDAAGNWSTAYSDTIELSRGWLSGWSYRKSVTLSRASGTVSNYQMRLLVGETSGATGENVDCGGHIRADFNDLRFTNSNGDLLNYWIESITGSTPNQLATVWIKFDSIGTGGTTFYMYYGKSDAPAANNDANTMSPGADFNDGTTTGLTITTAGSGAATTGSGVLHGVDTAATADGWLVGCMQPSGFFASVLAQQTADPSDTGSIRVLMLYDSASFPSPGVNTDMNPYLRFGASRRSPTHASPNKFYIFYQYNPQGTANAAVSSDNTTLTDTRLSLPTNTMVGAVVTCNGKTMTITSNSATVMTGASWSGGGNPGNGHAWTSTGHVNLYWDGVSAWSGTLTHFGDSGQYKVQVWDDGTNFKCDILNSSGASILTAVASISKSIVEPFAYGRAVLTGDQYTSHYYVGQNLDNMFFRQYLATEPAWGSWGTEQAN